MKTLTRLVVKFLEDHYTWSGKEDIGIPHGIRGKHQDADHVKVKMSLKALRKLVNRQATEGSLEITISLAKN